MALVLDDQQLMLQESASVFLNENAPIAHLRKLRDGNDATGFSRPLWKQFADMGFTGVMVPEAYGGLGLGHVEAGVLLQAIGHTLTPSPMFSTGVLAASAFTRFGTEAQKQQYLPAIGSAGVVIALAVDEGAKHRPASIRSELTAAEGGWLLSGSKTFVVDGHVADLLIVAARGGAGETTQGNAEDNITLLLVDPKAAGVSIERTVMTDAHNAARITFDGVKLAADSVLGGASQAGAGAAALAWLLDTGRAAAAAELVGLSDEVFQRTLAYLKERQQFGRTIGEYQALQHRAAHLHTEIEITRAAVLKAAQSLDAAVAQTGAGVSAGTSSGAAVTQAGASVSAGTSSGAAKTGAGVSAGTSAAARDVLIAKARAGASATLAVQEGVQMHGGMGMTEDLDFGLFMKRARVLQELFGDSDFHADRLAQLAGY